GVWLRITAFPGFRRLLAHRNRRCQSAGIHVARELRASISIHQSIDLLDALAHVAIVLDSRLRFPPAGSDAPRDVVAKSRFSGFDDPVRIVAQSKLALRALGLLSRRAPCLASPGAAVATLRRREDRLDA